MKVIFLIRDSYDARYVLSSLEDMMVENDVDVVLESGVHARRRKLKRFFAKQPVWRFPIQCLNIFALICYDRIMMRGMKKILGEPVYPERIRKLHVDDANEESCISIVRSLQPDVVLIYGTALLSRDTIAKMGVPLFNIHSSMLPYYRNVHSDFWAYVNNDPHRMGISIIRLDAGIDTGDIVSQKKSDIGPDDRLPDVKVKNLMSIPGAIRQFLEDFRQGTVRHTVQDRSVSSFYATPGLGDLVRLFWGRGLRQRR